MSFKRRKNNARSTSPHFEELEPRILYSADLAPQAEITEATVQTEPETQSPNNLSSPAEEFSAVSTQEILFLSPDDDIPPEEDANSEIPTNEVIFIGPTLNTLESQLASLNSEPYKNTFVVQLENEADAWTQILDTLSQYENLDAVHFITHGSEQGFRLGDQWIDSNNLHEFENEFRVMQLSLSEHADLLFYGCNLAEDRSGQQMLSTIADWTGADVAASTDLTGHASLGGDWELEYQNGIIETATPAALVHWQGVLSPPTDIATGITINTNGGDDVFFETKNAINSNLTQLTIEASFAIDTPNVVDNNLLSYLNGFVHNELYLTVQASGKINFGADSIGTGEFISSGTYAQLLDGNRHHVAVSWDNSNGAVVLYIDGALAESTTGYKTGATVNSGGTLVLGQDQDIFSTKDPDQAFKGTYYDTRIWNTIRSATEIGDNYQHSFDSGNIPAGLVANWQMKEVISSDTIIDLVNPGVADLEIKHVSGGGFTAGTIKDTLDVNENAANTTHVGFVMPTDPDPGAIPSYTYTLTDSAGGRFAIDLNSGEIMVANGSLLDYEASSSHNITVEVTDGDSNTFSKAITIQLNDVNDAPIASAGGPYTVGKGGSLTPSGSASSDQDGDSLTYAWDIDNNGSYGDVTGETPTLTWTELQGYGINTDGTYTIGLRVDDGNGASSTHSTTVTVAENAPTDLSTGIELNTDGGNDAYLIADNGSTLLGGLTALTLETSFSLHDHDNEPGLISYYVGGDEIRLRFDTTDHLRLKINNDNVTTSATYSELLDGNQHHVAVSWDNTNGDVMFYIDGEFVERITGLQAGHTIAAGGELAIGNDQNGLNSGYSTGQTFHGTFHDVRIWNQIRSAEEIALNYPHKLALTPAEAAAIGLVANWQMDGFNGSNEVVDIVSGNNLSVGHASGAGFVTSTPSSGLRVNENAPDGTTVGHVVPHDSDIYNDIVTDGLFLEHTMGGTFEQVAVGNPIGDWDVINETAVVYNDDATYGSTPLGGRPIELGMSNGPATIEQDLNTVSGRQYQVTFSMSGDWVGGDATKNLRVHTGAIDTDFSMDEPNNWSTSNRVWDTRSVTFTATGATTTLAFQSLVTNIPQYNVLISDVRVIEIPEAVSKILADDPTLSYDAGTGKFYRAISTPELWVDAMSDAMGSTLNGISGTLVTINSSYEQSLVLGLATSIGSDVFIGASDSATEGDWYWYDGTTATTQFWTGDDTGSAMPNTYTSWKPTEPSALADNEDYARIELSSGLWKDTGGASYAYIIEWNANEVLSNYTFSLTDDAGGRFAIDSSTGKITVADTSLIDYETATSHNITVEVTDAMGYSDSEVMAVVVNNQGGEPTQTLPGAQATDEDTSITFSGGNGNAVTVSETSAGNELLQVTLTVTNGTLTLSQTTGLSIPGGSNSSAHMVLQGTESDLNAAMEGMVYTPTGGYTGAANLSITTAQAASLEGYYSFDAGNAQDESVGITHNGVIMNGTPTIDPERGNVLSFDGTDDYVGISSDFGQPANITIGGWVNLTNTGHAEFISLDDRVLIALDDANGIRGAIQTAPLTWVNLDSEQFIAYSGWHHVMYSFDDANNTHSLYLDGVVVTSETITDSIDYFGATTTYLGKHPSNTSWDFTGDMDDVRVYTRALSTDEIAALATDQTSVTGNVVITVNAVNEAPAFTNLDATPGFTENGTAIVLDTDVTISDAELGPADNYSGATLTLSRNGGANGEDIFSASGNLAALSEGGNLQISGVTIGTVTTNSAGTLQLTFNSNATQARVNETLQSIAYSNSSESPAATAQIDWVFDDGNAGAQGSGGALTANGSTIVNITAVNDAPTLVASSLLNSITEDDTGNTGTLISQMVDTEATDPDAGALKGIAITAANTSNGSWEYTLDGTNWNSLGTPATTAAVLLPSDANTRIRFIPNADYNGASGLLSYKAWDQTSGVAGGTADVTTSGGTTAFSASTNGTSVSVSPINDEQIIATNSGTTVIKGSTANVITTAMLETTDVDNTPAELVYTVNAIPSNGTLYNNGVVLNNSDTFTQADINAGLITYDHDNSATTTDTMAFSVDDGADSNSAQLFTWTINASNTAPTITSDGGGAVAAINVDENQTAVTTVTSSDVDGGTPIYSISGGADQALFAIDSASGALTFGSGRDFESPSDNNTDGIYEVEVTVDDGNGGSDVQTINVTIANVDEAPTLGGVTGVTINEGGTAGGTITATDPDGLTDGTYYSVSTPASNGSTAIHPSTGVWSYTPTNANWFGVDNFVVTITDDFGGTTTVGVTVTVNNVDDLPSITGNIAGSGNENTVITGDLNASDLDGLTDGSYFSVTTPATQGTAAIDPVNGNWSFTPTNPDWFGSDTFTITVTDDQGGTQTQVIAVTVFNVDDPAVISGDISYTGNEGDMAPGDMDATDIEGLTDGSYFTISSPASNGLAVINPVSGIWSFTPTDPDWFGSDSFTVTVTDDLGGTTTQLVNITLANVNDAPLITSNGGGASASHSQSEGSTPVTTVTATDIEGDSLSYSINGGADAALFNIHASTGALSFNAAPAFNTPTDANADNSYEVIVEVSDGQGGSDSQWLSITVTDNGNTAPALTDQTTHLAENANNGHTVFDINDSGTGTDQDADGDSLSYTLISGNDDGLFALNALTGVVTLVDADKLDYETSTTYVLQIQASDGSLSSSAQLTIQIDNVNEAPVIAAPGHLTVDEDVELSINAVSLSDPDAANNQVSVTLTSTHGVMALGDQSSLSSIPVSGALDQFTITGSISAINQALAGLVFTPDENYNGAASITMIANDLGNTGSGSALSDSETMSITIAPVNDEPALDVPEQVEIAPGEAIEFSTALNNLSPLQDLDSQSTTHTLSLSIENASLSLTDDSLLSQVTFDDSSHSMTATGDMAAMNSILNALIITPDDNFFGELTLDLYLEDEGSVTVGGTRSLSTQIHLIVPSPPLPIDSHEESQNQQDQESSESEQLILIEFDDVLERNRTDNEKDSEEEQIIPPLVFDTYLNTAETMAEASSSSLNLDNELLATPQETDNTKLKVKFDLLKATLLSVETDAYQNSAFTPSLKGLAEGLATPDEFSEVKLGVRLAEITGAGLVVGSVVWLLKSSSLLSSLLVSYPAWRGMDPLPVLLPKDNAGASSDDEIKEERVKNQRFALKEIGTPESRW